MAGLLDGGGVGDPHGDSLGSDSGRRHVTGLPWRLWWRTDQSARVLADRDNNGQSDGAATSVRPAVGWPCRPPTG
jgi:hypothetical protein